MGRSPLQRVRKICLALPGTKEKLAWGAPTFRVGPRERMFATFSDGHHGDGKLAVWCPAPLGQQEVLVAAEPERYFRPAYVGKSGWIGIVLARVDDDQLARHVRTAYREVAPRTLVAELGSEED
jgi:hypothetical protein